MTCPPSRGATMRYISGIPFHPTVEAGELRAGRDRRGTAWAHPTEHEYGEIRGTDGQGKTTVKAWAGPESESPIAWLWHQRDEEGAHDETKALLGFTTEAAARAAIAGAFPHGAHPDGTLTMTTTDGLQDWLDDGEQLADAADRHHHDILNHRPGPIATFGGKRLPAEFLEAPREAAKADGHTEAQPGDRWITMHPNGPGTKGHAVLLRPVKGSSGQFHVVGGAGGKLNMLKINLTKSPEEWRAESRERATVRRREEKARREMMTPEERAQEDSARSEAKEMKAAAERRFIRAVLGTPEEQPDLFGEGQGEEADPKNAHRELLKKAMATCREAQRRILLDADIRKEAGIQEIGGAGGLRIDEVITDSTGKGPGYQDAIRAQAEANGWSAEQIAEAAAAFRGKAAAARDVPPPPLADGEEHQAVQAVAAQGEATADEAVAVALQTKAIRERSQQAQREAIGKALENNKAMTGMLQARAELRKALADIGAKNAPRMFEGGYQVTSSDLTPEMHEAIVRDVEDSLLRGHVAAFLDEIEGHGPTSTLDAWEGHSEEGMHATRGAAAFDALHEVSLAAMGAGCINRDAVEILGPDGAAQVVARAIRQRFTPTEQEEILRAIEEHHVQDQHATLADATREAQALRSEAEAIGREVVLTPRDFALAAEMHRNKVKMLGEARNILAGALGRMEARAALIASLQSTPREQLQVPLGPITPERALAMAGALGMDAGGFTMDREHGEMILNVQASGMDSMIKPVDSAALGEREVAMALKRGDFDEEGFLPQGFSRRQKARADNQLQEPPAFDRKIQLRDESRDGIRQALIEHIGGRWADGHRATDINGDLRGTALRTAIPEHLHATATEILNELVPDQETVRDEAGNPVPMMHDGEVVKDTAGNVLYKTRTRDIKEVASDLEKIGQHHLSTHEDEAGRTLHGQTVDADSPEFADAIHRALAADPRRAAAFIPSGELTSDHANALRDAFYREFHGVASGSEHRTKALEEAIKGLGPEPPQFDEMTSGLGLFDDGPTDNPAWTEWQKNRARIAMRFEGPDAAGPWREAIEEEDDRLEPHQKAKLPSTAPFKSGWAAFVEKMGGLKAAQEAVQHHMRDGFLRDFHQHYSASTGRQLQAENASMGAAFRKATRALTPEEQAVAEANRNRRDVSGRYAGAGRQGEAAQAGALFGMDDLEPEAQEEKAAWQMPEKVHGERLTLGQRLEQQIAQAMPTAEQAFQGPMAKPTTVAEGMSMTGRFSAQQRAVKAIKHLKRLGLFYGAGSGKTGIMLGGITELHHAGKLQKAIMAVPSVVQGQFGSEAPKFIDPSTGFKIHARPGASFEERLAAYRDPGTHAVVVTHQSLRDDTIKLIAQHQGKDEDAVRTWIQEAPAEDLKRAQREAFEAAGIHHNALLVDEGHDALNRKGKADSTLAKVLDAHGHNAEYYVGATGSPVKNDPSEAFDWLHKIDPARYPKASRDEFLRRHGVDTALTQRSMKQELSRYFFADRVHPGVAAVTHDATIPVGAEQQADIDRIEQASAKLRTGQDPVRWAKELAPASFAGKPEEEHAAIAEKVKKAVGTFRESALDRAINAHPKSAKIQHHIDVVKDRIAEGKPVVIFAHRLEAVDAIHKALEDQGIKVTSLTGRDSSADKVAKAAQFQPTGWDHPDPTKRVKPAVDVIVLSDAAATGLNLQRGATLIHHDQPQTYKTWEQRSARIHRLGQTRDVELINAMADHPYDRAQRDRVKRKQVLAEIYQSPHGYLDDSGLADTLKRVRARRAQALLGGVA